MAAESADDDSWRALPLCDRLAHKAWRARLSAHEELARAFAQAPGQDAIVFREHIDAMRAAPSETNVAVLDAALAALKEYIANAPRDLCCRAVRPTALPLAIERGLGGMRPSTRARALDVLVEFVALDGHAAVAAELCGYVSHKQTKLAAAAVSAMAALVRAFGVAAQEDARVYLKSVGAIFEHTDKAVKSEGVALLCEIARWRGSAFVMDAAASLKPIQLKELQENLARMSAEAPPRPTRYRHGCEPQGDASATPMAIDDIASAGAETCAVSASAAPAQPVDMYEHAEAIDISSRIPPTLFESLASPKWKDRKEALDALLGAIRVPRIQESHTGLISALSNALCARVASDANVLVVASAAQCLEALALGLRKAFAPLRNDAMGVLLERCKEKNRAVVEALRGALDALVYAIQSLSDLFAGDPPLLQPFAAHKNPQVRAETMLFASRLLPRIFRQGPNAKRDTKAVCTLLLPLLDDSVPEVREAATSLAAGLIQVAGSQAVLPFMDGVDKLKLAKITAKAAESQPAPNAAQPAPATQATMTKPAATATDRAPAVSKPTMQPSAAISDKRPPSASSSAHKATEKKASLASLSYRHTGESAVRAFEEVFGADVIVSLSDSAWKTRLEAVESICARLGAVPGGRRSVSSALDAEAVVRFLAAKPGWKESNVQIVARMVAVVAQLARDCESAGMTHETTALVAPALVDRLADAKLVTPIREALSSLAAYSGVEFVIESMAEIVRIHKSPKVISEALSWMAQALAEKSADASVDVQQCAAIVRGAFANPNAAVRTAATRLAGAMYRCAGPVVKNMFTGLQASQLAVLEAEFSAVAAQPISQQSSIEQPMVIDSEPANVPSACEMKDDTQVAQASQPVLSQVSVDECEIQPRADLTSALSECIAPMGDSNWKLRKEALDRAASIVTKCNGYGRLNTTEFMSELKARFSDANKNLVVQALDLAASIAVALGASFEKQLRHCLAPAVATLADIKPQVRAASLRFLTAVNGAGCSVGSMASILASSLSGSDSPHLRRELCQWLAEPGRMSTISKATEDDRNALVVSAFSCMQDRNADVRKAASALVEACMSSVGRESVLRLCTGSERASILPIVRQLGTNNTSAPVSIAPATPMVSTPKKAGQAMVLGRSPRVDADPSTSLALGGPMLKTTDMTLRTVRLEQEVRGTGPTWSPTAAISDQVEALRALMLTPIDGKPAPFAAHSVRLLLSADGREALLAMAHLHTTLQSSDASSAILANSDILLKLVVCRLADATLAMQMRALDVLDTVVGALDAANARLSDTEMAKFVPAFAMRAGELRDAARTRARSMFRPLCRLYPASKLVGQLISALGAASSRSRIFVLSEVHALLSRGGALVIHAGQHIPPLASLLSSNDATVRQATLDVLALVFSLTKTDGSTCDIGRADLDAIQERLRRGTLLFSVELPTDVLPCHAEDEPASQRPDLGDVPQVFALDNSIVGSGTPRRHVVAPEEPAVCATLDRPADAVLLPNPFAATECTHAVDSVIMAVSSAPDLECAAALQRLEAHIVSASNSEPQVLARMPRIVGSLCVRLRDCITPVVVEEDTAQKSRLCRQVVNSLVSIANSRVCVNALSCTALRDVLRETLAALVSDRIASAEESEHLSRTLNVLLVRTLENGDATAVFSALIGLLEETLRVAPPAGTPASSPLVQLPEFVMKCLWKMTKQIGALLAAPGEKPSSPRSSLALRPHATLDAVQVLSDIETFFRALPPMEWKLRASHQCPLGDLPLRTIKTILHELCTAMRASLVPAVLSLPGASEGFVLPYVRTMLGAMGVDVAVLYPSAPVSKEISQETANTQELSATEIDARLAEICARICSKPDTRTGLLELRDLIAAHGSYAYDRIDAALVSLGSFFYKYIKRNLAQLEAESFVKTGEPIPSNASGSGSAAEVYKSRLAEFQRQMAAGPGRSTSEKENAPSTPLRNAADTAEKSLGDSASKLSALRVSPACAPDSAPATPGRTSTIVGLKERLARLRQGE